MAEHVNEVSEEVSTPGLKALSHQTWHALHSPLARAKDRQYTAKTIDTNGFQSAALRLLHPTWKGLNPSRPAVPCLMAGRCFPTGHYNGLHQHVETTIAQSTGLLAIIITMVYFLPGAWCKGGDDKTLQHYYSATESLSWCMSLVGITARPTLSLFLPVC